MTSSPSTAWNVVQILGFARMDSNRLICVSSMIPFGEHCDTLILQLSLDQGLKMLEQLPEDLPRLDLKTRLKQAAGQLLCSGRHQQQTELVGQVWLRQIDEWRMQRQERQFSHRPSVVSSSPSVEVSASTPAHAENARATLATTRRTSRAQAVTIGQFGAQIATPQSLLAPRPPANLNDMSHPVTHYGDRITSSREFSSRSTSPRHGVRPDALFRAPMDGDSLTVRAPARSADRAAPRMSAGALLESAAAQVLNPYPEDGWTLPFYPGSITTPPRTPSLEASEPRGSSFSADRASEETIANLQTRDGWDHAAEYWSHFSDGLSERHELPIWLPRGSRWRNSEETYVDPFRWTHETRPSSDMVPKPAMSDEDRAELRKTQFQEECRICWEDLGDPCETPCGHIFCTECVRPWIVKKRTCPTCRQYVFWRELVKVSS